MREAAHRNLYTVANSLAMNNVGPETTVKAKDAQIITTIETIRTICILAFMICLVIHIVRRVQFSKTEEYMGYKEYRKSLKK